MNQNLGIDTAHRQNQMGSGPSGTEELVYWREATGHSNGLLKPGNR